VTKPDKLTASWVLEARWISGCGPSGVQSGIGAACNRIRSSSCSSAGRHLLRRCVGMGGPCAMIGLCRMPRRL
jgi:hypothetical protein